jgi:hypothetical protein
MVRETRRTYVAADRSTVLGDRSAAKWGRPSWLVLAEYGKK